MIRLRRTIRVTLRASMGGLGIRRPTQMVALAFVIGALFFLGLARTRADQAAQGPLGSFTATGLVAGPALGVPKHVMAAAGYTYPHLHAGPEYAYVISGTWQVTDESGTKTYHAGDFFWAPPGHIHTSHAVTDAEVFTLSFTPPGVRDTIGYAPLLGTVKALFLGTFVATSLPAGLATAHPEHVVVPTGYTSKQVHGGPQYVYVISGSLEIADANGVKAYHAGDFYWEPQGNVYTLRVTTDAEVFTLTLTSPGADTTIPLIRAVPKVTSSGEQGSSAAFTVSFSSTEPGQGRVYFGSGPGCSGLVEVATQDLRSGTATHTVNVVGNDLPGTVGDNGIVPGATYWYEVVTITKSGEQIDNNGGKCYSVTIPKA